MLRCNMKTAPRNLRLSLEDLVGDLVHARRLEDLGRLALLSYCEVRHWARWAGDPQLARTSSAMITDVPVSRTAFLSHIDGLIVQLEARCREMADSEI